MSTQLFSVIIPLYNKAEYISRALDSVFAQKYTNYEVVIVDDESSDGSLDVVEQYFDEMGGIPNNVEIVKQGHAGVGAARNNGAAHSTGTYLAFLDADDWWKEGYLSELRGLISRWPQAKMFGTGYYIRKDGKEEVAPIALEDGFEEGLIVYHEVYDRSPNLCMPLTANSYCINRQAFEEIGGYRTDLTLGEDLYLWMQASLHYPLAFLNKPLSVYCNDVNPEYRALGKRHKPEGHVFFHLEAFKLEEESSPLLKKLLDRTRIGTLNEYYFIQEYHQAALKLVDEVD